MDLRLHAIEPEGPRQLAPPPGAASIHDVFDGLELGVYSALHSFPRARFFRLEDHFDRTDASMRRLGWREELDREALRRALDEVTRAAPHDSLRLRFDVLAEPARGLGTYARLLLASEPHQGVPREQLELGVSVGLLRDRARHTPLVKTAQWVLDRRPYPIGTADAADHVLIDGEGCILEGTSSNLFFVRAGSLVTAGDGVLEGIVRKVVLEIAREIELPIHFERLPLERIAECQEAFLTSSTRHVLPVVHVGSSPVGTGLVGPITRDLARRYEELAEREARPAWA